MKPFEQGYSIFVKGKLFEGTKMLKGNPFHPRSVASKEWERGFTSAYYKNLERRYDFSEKTSRKSFQNKGDKYGKRDQYGRYGGSDQRVGKTTT
tara:strand:- start:3 stop:284 length:282 start_codon:yes stop_codon:yes gene_type:complete